VIALRRHHRRAVVLLGLLGMLALALAPTLSRALAAPGGGGALAWICTPQGLKRVPAEDGGRSGPATAGHADACAYCLFGAGAAPLPASPPVLPDGATATVTARGLGADPIPASPHGAALPRGPPRGA
jgi:hypothetical protein